MNRYKKEELRKYREARAGLTPEEIAEFDAKEAAAEATKHKVQRFHSLLFPEEYDAYYDSISDSKLRSQGQNPMSADYIERTNARRKDLGFDAFSVGNTPVPNPTVGWDGVHKTNTRDWVHSMVCDGKEEDLEKIIQNRKDVDAAREDAIQRDAKKQLDKVLESKAFFEAKYGSKYDDPHQPSAVAFRLYGWWFTFQIKGSDEEFVEQLLRFCPQLSNEECIALKQEALDAWIEIYYPD